MNDFSQYEKFLLKFNTPHQIKGEFQGLHVLSGAYKYHRVITSNRNSIGGLQASNPFSRRLDHNGLTLIERIVDPIFINNETDPANEQPLEILMLRHQVGYVKADSFVENGFRTVSVAQRQIAAGGTFTVAQDFGIMGPLNHRSMQTDWGYWTGTVYGDQAFAIQMFKIMDTFGTTLIPVAAGSSKAFAAGPPAHYFDLDTSVFDTKFNGSTISGAATLTDPRIGSRIPLGLASRHLLRIVNTSASTGNYEWVAGIKTR